MYLFAFVLALLALGHVITAKSCAAFDSSFNLYIFGGTKDANLGQQESWSANPVVTGTPLTITARPPFNGTNTQCFLSQYFNALYVLNADTTQAGNMHIYNFGSQSWSTQQVNLNGVDPNTVLALLDRDTNAIFGLSNSTLYRLNMGEQSNAGDAIGWEYVGSPPWTANNSYPNPVMALANNHIHFLNTNQPGSAAIYVVHFAYFQQEWQQYSGANGGSTFPSSKGNTASFFRGDDETPQQFAFIPEDGSGTYVVDVTQNSTYTMRGPDNKSTGSIYSASQRALVQLTQSGEIYFLPFSATDFAANAQATWSKMNLDTPLFPATNTTAAGSGSSSTTTNGGFEVRMQPKLAAIALGYLYLGWNWI